MEISLPEHEGTIYFSRVVLPLLKINKCPFYVQTFSTHTFYYEPKQSPTYASCAGMKSFLFDTSRIIQLAGEEQKAT